MTDSDTDGDFLDLPDRSLRPVVVAAVIAAGLAVTAARLLFAVTDEDERPVGRPGSVAEYASDAATRPAAVLPGIEELLAGVELPEGPRGGLVVADTGVTSVADRFSPQEATTTFAAVIDNPHPGWTARSVEVLVDVVATGGDIVHSARFLLPSVAAGHPVGVAGVAPEVSTAERVDVSMTVALWSAEADPAPSVTASEPVTVRDPLGGVTSTVTVTNRSDVALRDVGVVVIHRRADDSLIGGLDAFVDTLGPGESVDVTVAVPVDIDPATIARSDVYVSHRVDR